MTSGRVLHVITSTQRRGAETFAVDLDRALRSAGWVSEVVALAHNGTGSRRAGSAGVGGDGGRSMLDVEALGPAPLSPTTLHALRRRAASAEVVVAHGSRTLLACEIAFVGAGVPVVYRSIGDPRAWSSIGSRRVRTGWMLRRCTAVVALWPAAADTLRRLHRVPADRVHVIPNGVPAERCPVPDPAARLAARERFGLPPEAPVVVCIGALSPEKRIGNAIDAVASLPDVHLLVVGDGPQRRELEQQASASASASGRVHFAGVLDGPGAALAAADVVVLSSRTEGMPGVLVEAGLSGVAAVATDVGGVREIVRDGETGFVVPPGDVPALAERLQQALEKAPVLGAAARDHCLAQFEIGAVATRWAALLDGISSPRDRRGDPPHAGPGDGESA